MPQPDHTVRRHRPYRRTAAAERHVVPLLHAALYRHRAVQVHPAVDRARLQLSVVDLGDLEFYAAVRWFEVEDFALALRAFETDVDAAVLRTARDVAGGAVDAHAAVDRLQVDR